MKTIHRYLFLALALLVTIFGLFLFLKQKKPKVVNAQTQLAIANVTDNRSSYPGGQIPKYEKLEISFDIQNSVATNFFYPYDPTQPIGDLDYLQSQGISVEAVFTSPSGQIYHQPAFYYDEITSDASGQPLIKKSWDGQDHEWLYPTGNAFWKVRFSPHQTGNWQYYLVVQDAGGSTQSSPQSFTVVSSSNPGFIKVSPTDSRYFEYDDGTVFQPLGFSYGASFDFPVLDNQPKFQTYGQNGINLVRVWISGMFGSAWLEWLGGRNIYDGYLPRAGLLPFVNPNAGQITLTQLIRYPMTDASGNQLWFDACRFQFWNDPEAVKQNTDYKLQIKYWGKNITGPRNPNSPNFGLVGKVGGWDPNCYEPGVGTVITGYGQNTSDWQTLEGTWNSGNNNFLPRLLIGMENVNQGDAYVESISLREILPGGQLGPEIIKESSFRYNEYIGREQSYALDKIVELAEQNGVYLKLVLMEKNDNVYTKLDDDNTFVHSGESDNLDGFYGLGRTANNTRWFQQAWWRYLQARWGYSPAIHSWEATNEGDPWRGTHYGLTDEMGKFFHCQVFGVSVPSGNGQTCGLDHPNDHLVTTSFWHSFPGEQFWGSADYPNVDYADVHAYVSTGWQNNPAHETDTALFHIDYAADVRSNLDWYTNIAGISTKPIIRGEAGIDFVNAQTEQPDLTLDTQGIWLHNYTWAALHPGALTELYWWKNNIDTKPGPDGQIGLFEVYKYFRQFIDNIPLNSGNYIDIQSTLTDPNLRVVGQKDSANNRAHLWVQNVNHTWRKVVDGTAQTGLTGTVTISGFTPNVRLPVEWHEFTTQGTPQVRTSSVSTDSLGNLVLSLPTDSTISDVGIKIGNYTQQLAPGDANGDGRVDGIDYVVWLNHYNQSTGNGAGDGDFNGDGAVDGVDYVLWLGNYGT